MKIFFTPKINLFQNDKQNSGINNYTALKPLPSDTVSFCSKYQEKYEVTAQNRAKKIINIWQKEDYRINGHRDIKIKDILDVYEYFGWKFGSSGKGSSHCKKVHSPYASCPMIKSYGEADPNASAVLIRAVKLADRTNGELFITNHTPSDDEIDEFNKNVSSRMCVSRQIFCDGQMWETKNIYRENFEKKKYEFEPDFPAPKNSTEREELIQSLELTLLDAQNIADEAENILENISTDYVQEICPSLEKAGMLNEEEKENIENKMNELKTTLRRYKNQLKTKKNAITKNLQTKEIKSTQNSLLNLKTEIEGIKAKAEELFESLILIWTSVI